MNKRKIIIIGSIALAVIITVIIVMLMTCSNEIIEEIIEEENDSLNSLSDQRRNNILRLAESYMLAGEFDRALNLIDGILIENSDDEEAKALQRLILNMDRSGGADALLEAQKRLLEQQIRQNQELANMNRNNFAVSSGSVSGHSGQSAAEITAAAAAAREAEAARRAAEAEIAAARRAAEAEAAAVRRAAEEEERRRVLESLQAAADTSQGISTGAESVQFYDNLAELD